MRLWTLHPTVAGRDCEECRAWVYDETTGQKAQRFGKPYRRPLGTLPPCGACPKIPAGVVPKPENGVDLDDKNRRAYRHYRECRAVLSFPEDPIVRRNAALIRQAEDEAAEQREYRWLEVMTARSRAGS